ncbi:MAG TPA: glycosyltransferase family 2 protein [Candidatus Tectomicrobia bacterium]|jgi:glycosyltransferase involved in cell wall biosynthesis
MGRLRHGVAVIPVHNEARTIGAIVAGVRAYLPVIVVDDASTDHSGRLAAAAGATVITLPKRRGKGAALRCGFAEALRRQAHVVVTLDGDGQHNPQDIPRLLEASQQAPRSIILGGRLSTGAVMPRHRLHAIRVASFWINWLGGCNIRDTQSGFRVYPAALLQALCLKHGGFLLESELLLKASQAGWGIRELSIQAVYYPGRRSQYRPVRDGTLAAAYLFYRSVRFWPSQLRRLWRGRLADQGQTREHGWRQTYVAARATALLPVLFLGMLGQLLLRHTGCDVLAPVIRGFYDQRLLHTPSTLGKAWHDHQQHKRWEYI